MDTEKERFTCTWCGEIIKVPKYAARRNAYVRNPDTAGVEHRFHTACHKEHMEWLSHK